MSDGSLDGRGDLVTVVIGGLWCFCCRTDSSLVSICAINVARVLVKHELTKYIGVDASFVHTVVQDQVLTLQYVPSKL